MSNMNIAGKIKLIGETKVVGSGFKKRDLVLVTNEKYPQSILVEMTQENCDSLDRFNEGDEVKVAINIRGREWTSPQGEVKYFNSIQGWRIDSEVEEVTTADHSPDRDDLPF
jgi:translation initiation factor IF-3